MTKEELLARVRNDYTFHPATPEQAEKYAATRADALALAERLIERCPVGRELAIALTAIDEVVYWANASIARGT